MMNKLVTLLALTLVPVAATADSLPKQVTDMECLVGTWKGSGSMTMGKDKAKIDLAMTCKRTSAQFGVACTTRFTGIPGLAAYEETDLFGYEPNSNTYHWFAVTNAGETHDHVAKLPDGEKISFVYNGTQDGKAFKEAIDMDFGKDGKSMAVHVDSVLAGQVIATMDLKAKK
jgi:hypothetical protein